MWYHFDKLRTKKVECIHFFWQIIWQKGTEKSKIVQGVSKCIFFSKFWE